MRRGICYQSCNCCQRRRSVWCNRELRFAFYLLSPSEFWISISLWFFSWRLVSLAQLKMTSVKDVKPQQLCFVMLSLYLSLLLCWSTADLECSIFCLTTESLYRELVKNCDDFQNLLSKYLIKFPFIFLAYSSAIVNRFTLCSFKIFFKVICIAFSFIFLAYSSAIYIGSG